MSLHVVYMKKKSILHFDQRTIKPLTIFANTRRKIHFDQRRIMPLTIFANTEKIYRIPFLSENFQYLLNYLT